MRLARFVNIVSKQTQMYNCTSNLEVIIRIAHIFDLYLQVDFEICRHLFTDDFPQYVCCHLALLTIWGNESMTERIRKAEQILATEHIHMSVLCCYC